jgi:hypothetical protein
VVKKEEFVAHVALLYVLVQLTVEGPAVPVDPHAVKVWEVKLYKPAFALSIARKEVEARRMRATQALLIFLISLLS